MILKDTHCHLHVEEFEEKIDLALERAAAAGLTEIWLMSVDMQSFAKNLEIIQQTKRKGEDNQPELKLFAGLDPELLTPGSDLYQPEIFQDLKYEQILEEMFARCEKAGSRIAGIGEIGIDHYWSKDEQVWEQQGKLFRYQLVLAREKRLPVSIHSRAAEEEVIGICRQFPEIPQIVLHSFTGSTEQFEQALELPNVKIGLNGIITYKSMADMLAFVRERISEHSGNSGNLDEAGFLLETDAPYLIPSAADRKELRRIYGAEINEPAQVKAILAHLS
ncbi:MAG: TatD family hydrolase [Candidatus Dojkabacteria bacterium]